LPWRVWRYAVFKGTRLPVKALFENPEGGARVAWQMSPLTIGAAISHEFLKTAN
jgi:hypothetical protein